MTKQLRNDPDHRMDLVVGHAAAWFPEGDLPKLNREHLPHWIEELRKAEATTRLLRYRLEDLLREQERRCFACGGPVVGRKDRVYCGATCRKRGNRGHVLPEFSAFPEHRSQM